MTVATALLIGFLAGSTFVTVVRIALDEIAHRREARSGLLQSELEARADRYAEAPELPFGWDLVPTTNLLGELGWAIKRSIEQTSPTGEPWYGYPELYVRHDLYYKQTHPVPGQFRSSLVDGEAAPVFWSQRSATAMAIECEDALVSLQRATWRQPSDPDRPTAEPPQL